MDLLLDFAYILCLLCSNSFVSWTLIIPDPVYERPARKCTTKKLYLEYIFNKINMLISYLHIQLKLNKKQKLFKFLSPDHQAQVLFLPFNVTPAEKVKQSSIHLPTVGRKVSRQTLSSVPRLGFLLWCDWKTVHRCPSRHPKKLYKQE